MSVIIERYTGVNPQKRQDNWKLITTIFPTEISNILVYTGPTNNEPHFLLVESASDDKSMNIGLTPFDNVARVIGAGGETDNELINPFNVDVKYEVAGENRSVILGVKLEPDKPQTLLRFTLV